LAREFDVAHACDDRCVIRYVAHRPSPPELQPRSRELENDAAWAEWELGTTVVVERVLDVFVLGLFGLALWAWLPDDRWIDALGVVCAIVVAGCVVGALALVALIACTPTATTVRTPK